MTNTDGVYVEGRQIDSGDRSGPKSARNVLMHPDVMPPCSKPRGGILREGLGFDRCGVGVVTNIGAGDHLGLNYITTVDDLAGAQARDRAERGPKRFAVPNAPTRSWWRWRPARPGPTADRPPSRDGGAPRLGGARSSSTATIVASGALAARACRCVTSAITRKWHHRLPGRERHGRRWRRLGLRPGTRSAQRVGELRQRHADNARPLQRDGLSRRDRDRRLVVTTRTRCDGGSFRRRGHVGQAS